MADRRHKTHEDHVRKVKLAHGDSLIVVGKYVRASDRVLYKCPKHGRFLAFPSNVEHGTKCAECSRLAQRNTHEEHVRRVLAVHADRLQVVGRFVDFKTKVKYACVNRRHGTWMAAPGNVEKGSGCRLCYNERVSVRTRKTHEQYTQELSGRGIEALEQYVKAHTSILHKCFAGHVWRAKPNTVLCYGCPLCDKSQYRRHRVKVGRREVLLQGSEPLAVVLLLRDEDVRPSDLVFSTREGKPSFEYEFGGVVRQYVPDMLHRSTNTVIEVKSPATLGLYDNTLFAQNKAKAKSVFDSSFDYRLMLIYRKRLVNLRYDWFKQPRHKVLSFFRREAAATDRRLSKNRV